jgi:putative ABC transport system permease protein
MYFSAISQAGLEREPGTRIAPHIPMNEFARDLRYVLRLLRRTPGTTIVAVLALALGIGVNTSSFISVNALVLHPLPYPNLERIMTVWENVPKLGAERNAAAPANYLDWKDQNTSFEQLAGYRPWDATLTGSADPERIQAYLVSPSYFAVLGMKPMLGRTFFNTDTDSERDPVVVISRDFWRSHLASAPNALGRKITLSGRAYTIVGVMPREFDFPLGTEVWVPLSLAGDAKNDRSVHSLMVLGLLKPGVSPPAARAEMGVLAQRLERRYPQTNQGRGVLVTPIRELTNNVTDRFVIALLGAAVFVLLLACANVGNLLMSRVTARQREFAVRRALGAGRLRIALQLAGESLVISLLAGGAGLLLADWGLALQGGMIPAQVRKWVAGLGNMHIDGAVVGFTLGMSVLAGLICSLPAIAQSLRATAGGGLNQSLKEGGRGASTGPGSSRLRSGLVVGEAALAMVLLVGAGVMVQTFRGALAFNQGFNPQHLLIMQVALPEQQYDRPASVRGFYDRTLHGLAALPQVTAASAYSNQGIAEGLRVEGRPEPRAGEPRPRIVAVSDRYFRALEIPILAGRPISSQDGEDTTPVVVLSEMVARHYWPDGSALGQRVRLGNTQSPWLTVMGVCGDTKDWFGGSIEPAAYVSFVQRPRPAMTIALRTAGDPLNAVQGARRQIREVDPNQPVYDVKSMEQLLAEQTSGVRAAAITMGRYAMIALLLAVTGIYAVTSYSVVQRTHEIGIRVALGAARGNILGLAMRQGMGLAAMGLGIGIPAAFLMTRLMSSFLYNALAVSLAPFAVFTLALGFSALLASYIPAQRAARIDPMVALREE